MLMAVINYEGLLSLEAELKVVDWDLMVCDEAIWIKNPSAKRSKACFRVGRSAESRLILTGMPITKNILDLYGLYHFLEPGLLGFTSLYGYQNYYCLLDFFGSYRGYKPGTIAELMDRIARTSFVVKRAQCLNLPPKIYKTVKVEMSKEQSAAYDMMLARSIVDLERELNEDPTQARAATAVAKIIRLAQITSGYLPDTEGVVHAFTPNTKIEAIDEMLEDLPADEKIVIWARFRQDLEQLLLHYTARGAVTIHGGTSDADRDEARRRFRDDPTCTVFIGQPQAGASASMNSWRRVIAFTSLTLGRCKTGRSPRTGSCAWASSAR
jgi:SNF2 family DNA or RNA helicase